MAFVECRDRFHRVCNLSHLVKHEDFIQGPFIFLQRQVDGLKSLLQHVELALPAEVFLRAQVDEKDTNLTQLRHPRSIMSMVNLRREQSSEQSVCEVLSSGTSSPLCGL